MGNLKIVVEDEVLKKFREEAIRRFGYTKGSLSIAAREAFKKWLESEKEKGEEERRKSFFTAIEKAAGIWKGEEGYKYVRKVRREAEKRLKRFRL